VRQCGSVEVWQCGSVEVWKSGSVEVWTSGSVEVWKSGSVEVCAHGTPMGTKMAVAIANIFMVGIETKLINQSSTKPRKWKRYIDDIFSLWDSNI